MAQKRQLAAIVFTDIKGYTALMQKDERSSVELRANHRRIFETTTQEYSGKIIQYFGDGTLSTFRDDYFIFFKLLLNQIITQMNKGSLLDFAEEGYFP